MSRPLWALVVNGWYCVTARGNERRAIFQESRDLQRLLEYIEEMTWRHGDRAEMTEPRKLVSLSKTLCEEVVVGEFGFEALFEHADEDGAVVAEDGVRFGPAGLGESVGKDFHFDGAFALGVEMTAGVAAEGFDEVVDAFGEVGGAQVWAQGAGVVHETQVMIGAGLEVLGPGGVFGAEALQPLKPLGSGRFGGRGGGDFAPGVAEEGVIFRGELAMGVAQQVEGTELVIGVRPEAFDEVFEAAEIIGDQ